MQEFHQNKCLEMELFSKVHSSLISPDNVLSNYAPKWFTNLHSYQSFMSLYSMFLLTLEVAVLFNLCRSDGYEIMPYFFFEIP